MNKYKGILLAGGTGSRLYPLTLVVSKQLLPVYDKPMIYYPLSTLMLLNIRDILVISTPTDIENIKKLLGNGAQWGLNFSYKVQDHPNGIAEAFILGADFIQSDNVCLVLGDNIFYMGEQINECIHAMGKNYGAVVCGCRVNDPERYGVVEFDENGCVLSIEEKPLHPKSNFAVMGLYFYTSDVVNKALSLKPSARGELEITDLNNKYLQEGRLRVVKMARGTAWMDAGTPDSLIEAAQFMQILEKRQGLKFSCPEEIALSKGFISIEQYKNLVDSYKQSLYKNYLKDLCA